MVKGRLWINIFSLLISVGLLSWVAACSNSQSKDDAPSQPNEQSEDLNPNPVYFLVTPAINESSLPEGVSQATDLKAKILSNGEFTDVDDFHLSEIPTGDFGDVLGADASSSQGDNQEKKFLANGQTSKNYEGLVELVIFDGDVEIHRISNVSLMKESKLGDGSVIGD
jgi:hypothetical protein